MLFKQLFLDGLFDFELFLNPSKFKILNQVFWIKFTEYLLRAEENTLQKLRILHVLVQPVAEQSVDEDLRQAVVEAFVITRTLEFCSQFGHLFPPFSKMMRDQLLYLFALEVLELLDKLLILIFVTLFLFCLL